MYRYIIEIGEMVISDWQWLLTYSTAMKTSQCLVDGGDFPVAFGLLSSRNCMDNLSDIVFVSIEAVDVESGFCIPSQFTQND